MVSGARSKTCHMDRVKDSCSSLLASPDELILPVTETCSNEEMALWIFTF